MNGLRPNARAHVKGRVREHEGYELQPYADSKGIWTVGVGHNMEAKPLPREVVDLLYEMDFQDAEREAATLPCWETLDDVRRGVLVEMTFQMGLGGVKKFKNMLKALGQRRWQQAYAEALDSQWARSDSPGRAKRLAEILLTGRYDN